MQLIPPLLVHLPRWCALEQNAASLPPSGKLLCIHPCALTSRGRRPGTSQGILAPPEGNFTAGPHLFTKWILVECLFVFPAVALQSHRPISPHEQPALQRSQLKEIFPHKGTMRVFGLAARVFGICPKHANSSGRSWIQFWVTIINISKVTRKWKGVAHCNEPTQNYFPNHSQWVSAHCTAVWHTTLRFTPVALVL